ncbi:hypothetical protein [Caulobacter sp. 1776]|uniref:hypothetical protein n=1 Tax=Caulobacter sp. 1776 TaxID=3156420 RepID=UPI003399C0D3
MKSEDIAGLVVLHLQKGLILQSTRGLSSTVTFQQGSADPTAVVTELLRLAAIGVLASEYALTSPAATAEHVVDEAKRRWDPGVP